MRAPKGGASHVGRIVQHAADRGGMPMDRAPTGLTAHLMQTSADVPQAQAIHADPPKDETDDVGLIVDHVEM